MAQEINAWIACKEGVVYGKLQNGKFFSIKGKRSLPNFLQMKRCSRKCHQIFLIHLSEVKDETKDNDFSIKRVKIFLDDFKDIFSEELKELPSTVRLTMLSS